MKPRKVVQCPNCDINMDWEEAIYTGTDKSEWILVCKKCKYVIEEYQAEESEL